MAEEIAYQVALVSAKGNQKLHKRLRVGDKTLMRYASYFCPVPEQLEFSCAVYERTQNPAQILQILKAYPTLLDSVDEETIQCIAKLLANGTGKQWLKFQIMSCPGATRVACHAALLSGRPIEAVWIASRAGYDMVCAEMKALTNVEFDPIKFVRYPRLGCGPITTSQNDV